MIPPTVCLSIQVKGLEWNYARQISFLEYSASRCENVILQWEFICADLRTRDTSSKECNQIISDQQRRKQCTSKFLKKLYGNYIIINFLYVCLCLCVVCLCVSQYCLYFIQQFKKTLIFWNLFGVYCVPECWDPQFTATFCFVYYKATVELHAFLVQNLCEINKTKPFCICNIKETVYRTISMHNMTMEFWD